MVYDGVGKDTFMSSLDCLRPAGMVVSFGSASGPVEHFNLGMLSAKGSLYVTRPTLFDLHPYPRADCSPAPAICSTSWVRAR